MKCAIMQPTYIPWLGYFDLIDYVDTFVLFDHVQLSKRTWQVRNRIKTSQGPLYLTIPIKKTKSRDETIICESVIDNTQKWKKKHLKAIELSYRKAPYFEEVFTCINDIYEKEHDILSDLTVESIVEISKQLSIQTNFVRSSSLQDLQSGREKSLVDICQKIGCSEYVCPESSSNYIEKKTEAGGEFSKNSIAVFYRIYEHPEYIQMYGEFQSYMGIIDLLFNYGFSHSLDIIRRGRKMILDHISFRSDVLRI